MQHTIDFLEKIAEQNGRRPTAYGVEQVMTSKYGWSRSSVYNYMRGRTVPSDAQAMDIATELDISPMYVLALVHEDRERDPEIKKIWALMADNIKNVAAVILSATSVPLWVLGAADSAAAKAPALAEAVREVCILCKNAADTWLRLLDRTADELDAVA